MKSKLNWLSRSYNVLTVEYKQTEKDDGLKMERGYRNFTVNKCGGRGRIKAMTVVLREGNGARLVGW